MMLRFRINLKNSLLISNLTIRHVTQAGSSVKETKVPAHENFNVQQIQTRTQKKLPARSPIAKNFFLGHVEKDLIPFPEVISRENLIELYKNIDEWKVPHSSFSVKNEKTVDSGTENIKTPRFFGNNIPQHLGGKGYFVSESLVLSEAESTDISSKLTKHRIVCDVISEYGTEEQKQYFLPKLADGTFIATEAIFEAAYTDNTFFGTTSFRDMGAVIVNGEKITFMEEKEPANLFCVITQSRGISSSGDNADGITVLLIESSMKGVSSQPTTHSKESFSKHRIKFENVKVGEENVLGSFNEGNSVAQSLLKYSRLRSALHISKHMKGFINLCTDTCIKTKQGGIYLKDMEFANDKLAKWICATYAMDSMIYFTAGLIDEFDKPDVDVEAAIVKIFAMEQLLLAQTSGMEFGNSFLLAEEEFNNLLREGKQLYTQGETMDSLRLYIGLLGLQHSGASIQENVRKGRNPLFHPGHIFKQILKRHDIENPKLVLNLGQELHPSLAGAATWLELSIARLQIAVEQLLTRHGSEIIHKHKDIMRLTECVVLIYAMFTSLSRASRSYCIGLQHADYEILIANVICLDSMNRVKIIAEEINKGEFATTDKNFLKIGKQLFKNGGYFSEHPIKFNY